MSIYVCMFVSVPSEIYIHTHTHTCIHTGAGVLGVAPAEGKEPFLGVDTPRLIII